MTDIYPVGKTIYWRYPTRDGTPVPITEAGSPAISVLKDGETTPRTYGVSLSVDSAYTGNHLVTIDTTQGDGYYEADSIYFVVASSGTVDGNTVVGEPIYAFRLGYYGADVLAWNGGAVPTPAEAGAAMTLTEAYDAAKTAAPSAATVAGAVLDEALGDHDGWLTTLLTAAGYTAPANSDIATLVSRITAERASYLDASISSRLAASGYGAQGAYTITPTTPLTDSVSGDPISGMTIKIYSNALRTETYLITEVTSDTEGSFTAHVTAPGTYYLRAIKEGYTTLEWTEVAA